MQLMDTLSGRKNFDTVDMKEECVGVATPS